MKKKINLFFFGAGSIIENHILAAKKLNCFNFYAIKSRTYHKAELLKKKYKIKYLINDYKKIRLLKNTINIAIIGVSIENTYNVFKKIYKTFDICLIEKPAGCNYYEAKKIYKLSRKCRNKFYVSLNRRFYSSTSKLKNFLNRDSSDRLLSITDTENPNLFNDKFDKKVLANWVFANSIHLIDYIKSICRGELHSLKLVTDQNKELRVFSLKFSSGDICIYTQIWNRPGPWSVNVSTKNKFFKLEPLEKLSYRDALSYKFHQIKIKKDDIHFKPGLIQIYKNLKLAANNKKNDLVSLKDSLNLMKLINQIQNKYN